MTEPVPGARLKQATSPAIASLFARRAPDLQASFFGFSNSQFSVTGLAPGTTVTFAVTPANKANYPAASSSFPPLVGDFFFAMGEDRISYVRGVVVSRTFVSSTTLNIGVLITKQNVITPTGVTIFNWAIQITPQNVNMIPVASGSLSGAAVSIPLVTSTGQYWGGVFLAFSGVSSNTATRILRAQLNSDTGANYISGRTTFDAATAPATSAAANMLPELTLTAAQTVSGCLIVTGIGATVGPVMYHSVARSSVPLMASIQGYYIGTPPITSVDLLWNGSGNFDAGTYEAFLFR